VARSRLADQVGRVVGGRYRLLAPVGTGASADVYVADDVTLRRRVAVKVLHDALAGDEAFLRRFRAEAQTVASLRHPNIMGVFDWGEERDGPFLVLEYLGGGSLRDLLDRGSRVSISQAVLVGLEAARGLDYAHRRGLIHRDVKPANLLFDDEGRLAIADFGIARALAEATWTEPVGAVVGTVRYASPEQARGNSVDGRADVYALALVLVEAVTGAVPFAADTTIATLMGRLDRPIPVWPGIGALAPAIEAAGAPSPGQRVDAAGLVRLLESATRHLPRPTPLPLASFQQLPLAEQGTEWATTAFVPLTRSGPLGGGGGARGAQVDLTTAHGPGVRVPTGLDVAPAWRAPEAGRADVTTVIPSWTPGVPAAGASDGVPVGGQDNGGQDNGGEGDSGSGGGGGAGRGASDGGVTISGGDGGGPSSGADGLGGPSTLITEPRPPAQRDEHEQHEDSVGRDGLGRRGQRTTAHRAARQGMATQGAAASTPAASTPASGSASRTGPPSGAGSAGATSSAERTRTPDRARRTAKVRRRLALTVGALLATAAAVVAAVLVAPALRPTYVVPTLNGHVAASELVAGKYRHFVVVAHDTRQRGAQMGTVVAQHPLAGGRVHAGTITVDVQIGQPLVGVPDLAGLTPDLAQQRLHDARLVLGTVAETFSDTVSPGRVASWVDQGAQIEEGQKVGITLSGGRRMVPMPDVRGQGVSAAIASLGAIGVTPDHIDQTQDWSDTYLAGQVSSSDPSSGGQADRGGKVTLVVSKGPQMVAIPPLSGYTREAARSRLLAAGLTVGNVYGQTGGLVVIARPSEGTVVRKGSAVVLVIL